MRTALSRVPKDEPAHAPEDASTHMPKKRSRLATHQGGRCVDGMWLSQLYTMTSATVLQHCIRKGVSAWENYYTIQGTLPCSAYNS